MLADRMDLEQRGPGTRGPLHGIPVLVKDNIDTADRMATTAGSMALVGSAPPEDSFVVRRLRIAGAILLGKTNLSEWAGNCGVSTRPTAGAVAGARPSIPMPWIVVHAVRVPDRQLQSVPIYVRSLLGQKRLGHCLALPRCAELWASGQRSDWSVDQELFRYPSHRTRLAQWHEPCGMLLPSCWVFLLEAIPST